MYTTLAFAYLLQKGAFHDACKLDNHGVITKDSAQKLMIVVSYLFGREVLNKRFYELNKDKFHNSKVLLPDLPDNFVQLLKDFNGFVDSSFENYMKAAGQIFPKDRENTVLPISNKKFKIEKAHDVGFNQVSPFAVLGQAHHMFSRFLNPRIYEFLLRNFILFVFLQGRSFLLR